jgi:beta-glucosidase
MVNVTVNLTNTGSRTGKEVVQLYVSFPDGIIDRDESGNITSPIDFPVRVLRNFDKVELNAAESRMVEMTLTRKDLSYWSTIRENWVMPVTGRFVIWVGRSSRDLPLRGEF